MKFARNGKRINRNLRLYYRPRSEASEGYVFTGVCHSFCSTPGRGGEWTTVWTTPPPHLGPGHISPPPRLGPGDIQQPPPHTWITVWTTPPPPTWITVWTTPPPPPPHLGPGHISPPGHNIPPTGSMRGRAVRILLECILVWSNSWYPD